MVGALVLGVSVSLDELAIGFSAGLLRLPVLPLVLAVAAQAFLLTQVGLVVGARAGKTLRKATENLAGVTLIALGGLLLIERLS